MCRPRSGHGGAVHEAGGPDEVASMANTWFVIRGGKETGPYSGQQLREMAAGGDLRPDDLVRRDDMSAARPARMVKGLFPAEGKATRPSGPGRPAADPPAHSPASKKRLVILSVVAAGLVLLCGGVGALFVVFSNQKQAAQKDLAEADGLWTSGDKAGAATKYRALLDNRGRRAALKPDELAPVYGRLIDFEAQSGRPDEARRLADEAANAKVTPAVSSAEGKALVTAGRNDPQPAGGPPPQGEVLTADFLPCIAGNVKKYEERRTDFDIRGPAATTTETVTFLKDNNMVVEWTISTPGQPPTGGKGSDKLVEKDGVIEWFGRIAIKVGAKPGDEWSGIRGKSKYKLVRFEKATAQGGGGKAVELDRAVIESRLTSDYGGRQSEHLTEYVLERGGGIQSEKTYMTAAGKKGLIRERRLVSSTYP